MAEKTKKKSVSIPLVIVIGALHTGTETGFTGFNVVSHELHTARRLRALHCWAGSHALCSSDPDDRPCGGKVVFGSEALIHIRFRSKVPYGEPHF